MIIIIITLTSNQKDAWDIFNDLYTGFNADYGKNIEKIPSRQVSLENVYMYFVNVVHKKLIYAFSNET